MNIWIFALINDSQSIIQRNIIQQCATPQVDPLRCPLPGIPQWQEHRNWPRHDDRGAGSGWEPVGAVLCLTWGKDNAYQGGNILAMIENRHPHHHHHHVKPTNIFHVTLAEING